MRARSVAAAVAFLAVLSGCSSDTDDHTPGTSAATPTVDPSPSSAVPSATSSVASPPTATPSARATGMRSSGGASSTSRATSSSAKAAAAPCLRTLVVGYSVQHRVIAACERGTRGGTVLLVVGNIHGNETLGWGVVSRLRTMAVPRGVDLWLVRSVNPDGSAHGTRGNAHGVDENRNWPFEWAPSPPGTSTYGGPRPLSEPETQALRAFLTSLRPRTVVVFHTPLDAVDYSEGADPAVTRFLARASGYPAAHLGARPGELTGWANAQPWPGDAVTFELGRSASPSDLDRVARALLSLGAWRAGS